LHFEVVLNIILNSLPLAKDQFENKEVKWADNYYLDFLMKDKFQISCSKKS